MVRDAELQALIKPVKHKVQREKQRLDTAHDSEPQSAISTDILVCLVTELIRHRDRNADDTYTLADWSSESGRTSVCQFGNRSSVYNVVNQVPGAVMAEYQLLFDSRIVYVWKEHRWPYLLEREEQSQSSVTLPDICLDELWAYHTQACTSWLTGFRKHLAVASQDTVKQTSINAASDPLLVG